MNKELVKLKKILVNSTKLSKEDIQAERLQKLILNARASQDFDINQFVIEFDKILKGEE